MTWIKLVRFAEAIRALPIKRQWNSALTLDKLGGQPVLKESIQEARRRRNTARPGSHDYLEAYKTLEGLLRLKKAVYGSNYGRHVTATRVKSHQPRSNRTPFRGGIKSQLGDG